MYATAIPPDVLARQELRGAALHHLAGRPQPSGRGWRSLIVRPATRV